MSESLIDLQVEGGIATLTLNRPDVLNSFDRAMAIDDNAVLDEHSRRDHEPDLANLAEPLAMGEQFGRNGCHQPVTGHRYTRPTGSKRAAFTS